MATNEGMNPYEAPLVDQSPIPANPFTETQGESIAELLQRIRVLEARVNRSWFLSSHFPLRVLAVWGYLLAGYLFLILVFFGLTLLLRAIGVAGW